MKKSLLYILLVFIIQACLDTKKEQNTSSSNTDQQSIKVPLNLKEGYKTNQVLLDTLEPIINSFGDTLLTGTPYKIEGKKVNPDTLAKPRKVLAGKPQVVFDNQNKKYISANELPTAKLDSSKLITTHLKENHPSFIVNSIGDTIISNRLIPVKGKIVPVVHPAPVQASPPVFRETASVHLKYLDLDQGMNFSKIRCAYEDKRGYIWIGTNGGGVSKYDGKSFTHYTTREGLPNNFIIDILEDKQGNLWLCTWGGGLSKFDGINFTNYTTKGGLVDDFILAIQEDSKGNLWIGSYVGLSKFDGEKSHSFYHQRRTKS